MENHTAKEVKQMFDEAEALYHPITEKERVLTMLYSKVETASDEGYHTTSGIMMDIAESLENDEITVRGVIKSLINQCPLI